MGYNLVQEAAGCSLNQASGDLSHCPLNDQRGLPRWLDGDLDGNYRCDVGAVEVQAGLPPQASYTLFLPPCGVRSVVQRWVFADIQVGKWFGENRLQR